MIFSDIIGMTIRLLMMSVILILGKRNAAVICTKSSDNLCEKIGLKIVDTFKVSPMLPLLSGNSA